MDKKTSMDSMNSEPRLVRITGCALAAGALSMAWVLSGCAAKPPVSISCTPLLPETWVDAVSMPELNTVYIAEKLSVSPDRTAHGRFGAAKCEPGITKAQIDAESGIVPSVSREGGPCFVMSILTTSPVEEEKRYSNIFVFCVAPPSASVRPA